MKDRQEMEQFEKLMGQLRGLYDEISLLARKSSNDGVNAFKLRLINKVLATANCILGPSHLPFDDFKQFDADDVPSNSDVTMVLAQYLEEAERHRANFVTELFGNKWVYVIDGGITDIPAGAPRKVTRK
ncbi:hypothetical protein SAMN05192583_3351 [Sphingomonas gellani]|uniref:Uncharacterized protein n=1 Tax=Sphingomonas gellani TaxID=1166340 RepID=A0A1H8IMJ8_9SPHN|nr:hypothetical protein [Sphingomonas gellani]SEN69943.1 hypothetical protein SAMN05192583_3351 [Sphingomonas gellani]